MFGEIRWVQISPGIADAEGSVSIFAVPAGVARERSILLLSERVDPGQAISLSRNDANVYLSGLMKRHFDPALPQNKKDGDEQRRALFYSRDAMEAMVEDIDALCLDIASSSSRGGMAFISKSHKDLVIVKKVAMPLIPVDFYQRLSRLLVKMIEQAPQGSVFAFLVR